jgi:F420-dependent oxidoreductase-like protein
MKISISVTNYSWQPDTREIASHLIDLASHLDSAGIDTVWVADHLLQMDPTASIEEPMLEAYTTLGFLAAVTSHLRLGTMVTWASIRPPALLIKAVTTLDVLSRGRAWLGIGAGYQGTEAAMMGLAFEPTAERFARLEETLQIGKQMWSGDEKPFEGKYHRLERPINEPPAVTRPKILIGGTGEQRTLPLVARYADACNLFDIPDGGATLRRKLEVLARVCEAVGRDRAEIETTLSTRLTPGETSGQFVERCAALSRLGVDHVVLVTTGPWTEAELGMVFSAVEPVRSLSTPR